MTIIKKAIWYILFGILFVLSKKNSYGLLFKDDESLQFLSHPSNDYWIFCLPFRIDIVLPSLFSFLED